MANRLLHLGRDDHDFLVITSLAKDVQHARVVLRGEIAHLGALDFNTTQANATHQGDDGDVPCANDGGCVNGVDEGLDLARGEIATLGGVVDLGGLDALGDVLIHAKFVIKELEEETNGDQGQFGGGGRIVLLEVILEGEDVFACGACDVV